MKNLFLFALLLGLFTFASCGDDDSDVEHTPMYHVHIHSPNAEDKVVGDVIDIKVDFEEHDGETVHHIKVRLFNKNTGEELLNEPSDPHIHETSGTYTYEKSITLTVDPDTEWVIEAKVWGHEDGLGEVSETVEFKVLP